MDKLIYPKTFNIPFKKTCLNFYETILTKKNKFKVKKIIKTN